MPPKKAAGKKKASPPQEVCEEEVQQKMEQLKEELDIEREENHFYQMECSMIQDMWEASEKEIYELEAKIRDEELEMIEDEEHLAKLKLCKQETKFLYRDNHYTVAEVKEEGQTMDEQAEQTHRKVKEKLQNKAVTITMKSQTAAQSFEKLSLDHERNMAWTEQKLKEDLETLRAEKLTDFEQLQTDLNNMRKTKIDTLFHEWNSLFTFMEKGHDSTLENQQKIVDLVKMDFEILERYRKENDDNMKREVMMVNELDSILRDNEHLSKLLSAAEEENVNLKKKLRNHPKYAQRYC